MRAEVPGSSATEQTRRLEQATECAERRARGARQEAAGGKGPGAGPETASAETVWLRVTCSRSTDRLVLARTRRP